MDLKASDIAFFFLLAACTIMEVMAIGAGALWILVVFWALVVYL